MNKRLLITLSLVIFNLSFCIAQNAQEKVDLDAVYRQIDEAIEQSPRYVADYQARIDHQRKAYLNETDIDRKAVMAEEMFALYKPFKNDSALYYAQVCIDIADSLSLKGMAGLYRSLMARQCSNAGMYVESLDFLRQVDKDSLDRQGLTEYYNAYMHVYGEIANLSLIPEESKRYWIKQDQYRDSVLMVADQGSDHYLHLQLLTLLAQQRNEEALKVSDNWINKVTDGTNADALASYFRHIVYARLNNGEMVRYWLGRSALSDIKCAVMDQASLITLAEILNADGDLDRSYRYIRFTWQCNNAFNTRLRSSQIAPVLSVIERNYSNVADRNKLILAVSTIVFCVMALGLLLMYRYVSRQKRRISATQLSLTTANEELVKANEKLTKMNERVTRYNKELFDINHELMNKNE